MKLQPKQRGLALATSGLGLAFGVIALLSAVGFVAITRAEWIALLAAGVATTGGSWVALHRGARLWRGWDPHFVLVPAVSVAILLSVFIWAATEIRLLALVVWPVVLIFLAGYVGFLTSVLLSALMTTGYLVAVTLARPPDARVEVEAILAVVFLITNFFASVVLGRVRHQRLSLAAARAELARLVNTDPLTELPNRRRFDEVFAAETARVLRYDARFCLAILDLDGFKAYNDRLGHPAGDEALCEIAALMQEGMRASDLVARLGGEEFALIMVEADQADALIVGERLRARISEHGFRSGTEHLTVSIGIACAPQDAVDSQALLGLADEALYAAKGAGRNRVMLASQVRGLANGTAQP